MNLRVLDEADAEAIDAANWYEGRSRGLGYDFRAELRRAFDRIQGAPHRHAKVEFARVVGDVRRVLLDRFPYLVVYQLFDDEILVLSVFRADRDQGYWKDRVRE